jgi:hypothetical protein
MPAFVKAHRDEAVSLYEAAAGSCLITSLGFQSLHALAALQSESARDALGRLRRETRSYDRALVVRAMLEDPAFREEARFDPLWRDELDARVRSEIASSLRRRRDPKSLSSIERWLPGEADPETRRALEMARAFIDHPDECELIGGQWSLLHLARCAYSCTGAVESPDDRWLGWQLLWCDERRVPGELIRAHAAAADRVEPALRLWLGPFAAGTLLAIVAAFVWQRRRARRA